MWCVTIGSHQQQKIIIKVQDGGGKKVKLSFRGWETTVIMSQELGKHMLVCCCWNRGASLRLRFGNMKGFVGWAGGLALIQGLIAREAGSKLRLWDRERNLVTYSREDRSSKQTQATGCWANHSVRIRAPSVAAAAAAAAAAAVRGEGLALPPDRTPRGGWTWRTGMHEVRRKVELVAPFPCRDPVPCRAQDAGSTLPYLDGVFGKQSRLCVVLLQPIKPLNSISIFEEDAQRSTWDVQGEQRWGGRQLTGLNNPQIAELNKACLRCNPINLANWIKLFRFYLCTAVAMYTHRASPQWSLSSSFSAGIRLIMSPFRLHMIMVDCLQVFSDVLAVPGHGGIELRAWKSLTHVVVLF